MRTKPKDWIFIDSMVLNIWSYKPINETHAKVSGVGKVWNDRVRIGDGIVVRAKNGKQARLVVNEITFTNETFDATVELDDYIDCTENRIIRFAWGNEKLKTWFVTKTKKAFLPQGSRLLYKMECEFTKKPSTITDSYPKPGDIINDTTGNKLKVLNIEWC